MEREFVSLYKCSVGEKIPVPPLKPLQLDDMPMWRKLPYDTKYPLLEYASKDITVSREDLGKSVCSYTSSFMLLRYSVTFYFC